VKKIKLTNGLLALATLFLFGNGAIAEDFEPQVLYQDQEYIDGHGGSSSNASASKSSSSVGSDFEPVVLYQNEEYIKSHSSTSTKPIKTKSTVVSSVKPASNNSSSSSSAASEAADSAAKAPEEGTSTIMYLLGIIAVAGVAYMMRKGGGSTAKESADNAVYGKDPSGKSGVERYLASVGGGAASAVTGVAKYLEEHASSAQTGVAKYLQNKG
jgi:hypothetical protein